MRAFAERLTPHPASWTGVENPNPGSDGTTTWNRSDSGPITLVKSAGEPGQPCTSTSGSAPGSTARTCAKWKVWPSIRVVNCGIAFSSASCRRQS